jgi:AraC-like DNA-binding protein
MQLASLIIPFRFKPKPIAFIVCSSIIYFHIARYIFLLLFPLLSVKKGRQLNVHVNHLNRAIKETTEKTTSQIIAERILRESKILLKHSAWNVSEIAYALGFTEVTHFNNFFKKHVQLSPLKFRNV